MVATGKVEHYAARESGWLAHTTAPRSSPGKNVLFVRPAGGADTRVNDAGTFAGHPSIDTGNPVYGDVLMFSQFDSAKAPGDIKRYDLGSGVVAEPPPGVNTSKSERVPSISGNYLLFGRGPADSFIKKVVLVDLTTGDAQVLADAYYVWPGGVKGDWVTWERCDRRCRLFRYRISTGTRTRVPPGSALPTPPPSTPTARCTSSRQARAAATTYACTGHGCTRAHA